ncbi:d5010805-00e1-419b-af2f-d1ff3e2afb0b-CDS [Sclerotinia trifoliorum]|uniref:D5010805-00e1-419b-af2f-d1ff3e2afb0b-CDS n=1 Tax=Sclerotinia trifoliorum TaxID=28548 RepID=A0A8H2VSZ8_9HELO|nr:d5010805-00e1-419b-af2f-d1ff3e2afb0b-CDS [Sclerotinia trifoliorum]
MGGKFWSKEEQTYFECEIMPMSRFNGPNGTYNPNIGKSWAELAVKMQKYLGGEGLARRVYTGNMLYEHWYQTVRKVWGEIRAKNARASAKAGGRGADRQPRTTRSKKPKQRANNMPPPSVVPREPERLLILPTRPRNEAIPSQGDTESPRHAQDNPQMGQVFAFESSFREFEGQNLAQRHYIGPSVASAQSSNHRFHRHRAPDRPYLTHAEGAESYHRLHLTGCLAGQRFCFSHEQEACSIAAFHQVLAGQERQTIIIREPTPEDDGQSLFIQQSQPEFNCRLPIPRPNTELDAAHTMTMFRSQEMTTLRGTPSTSRQNHETRSSLCQVHPHEYESQRHGTFPGPSLAPIISRQNTPRQGEIQGQVNQLEENSKEKEQ